MSLAKIFCNNEDLQNRLDKRIKELRQEYYGRLIDENDGSIETLERILHVLNDPSLYKDMHDAGLGNHAIADNLRINGVLNEAEATGIITALRTSKPSLN